MSYKIGQLRKNQISSYGTIMDSINEVGSIGLQIDNTYKTFYSINSSTPFKKDNNYYIRFQFTTSAAEGTEVKYLCSIFNSGDKKKQPIKYFSGIQKYEIVFENGKEVKKALPIICELVFTPNDNIYNKVVMESVDSSPYASIDSTKDSVTKKYKNIELQELINVIPRLNGGEVSIITKVGIQAPTGFMFMLNGEELHVGKSGIYEVEDVNIKNIGFAIKKNQSMPYPDKEDFFIMDYLYS